MADAPPGKVLSSAAAGKLLEGVDDPFRVALHGRYDNGIVAVMLGESGQSAQTLLLSNSGAQGRTLLSLQAAGQSDVSRAGRGIMVNSVSLADGAAQGVSITEQMLGKREFDGLSDVSALVSGVVFASAGCGHAGVRRSTTARRGRLGLAGRIGAADARHRDRPCGAGLMRGDCVKVSPLYRAGMTWHALGKRSFLKKRIKKYLLPEYALRRGARQPCRSFFACFFSQKEALDCP